jgi:hypothetical protein
MGKHARWTASLAFVCSSFVSAACAADTVVVQWTDVMLQIIRGTHPTPPVSARYLAILDTCMYDAWTVYDPRAVPTQANGIPRQGSALLPVVQQAVSFAAYRAIVDLFPSDTAGATQLMTSLGYDPNDTSTNVTTPTGVGNVACQAVLNYRHHDGSNQLGDVPGGEPGVPYSDYTGYAPVNTPDQINDPNRWQPLRVPNGMGGFVIQVYGNPYWGNVFKFNPKLPDFLTEGPDRYPSLDYAQGVDRILEYSAFLNDETKVIAEYWANGPSSELPPGHWALFGEFVSRRDSHSIADDVEMFFALGNAILDASIESWGTKTIFDSVRPVTAVHFLKNNQKVLAWGGPFQGTKQINGQDWQPYQALTVVTPPFPEYYSGHSVFSAAGAEVLKRFTGSPVFGDCFTQAPGTSRVEPGLTPQNPVTLCWSTFEEAADQAGMSRRYGGIHFIPGDLTGRALGQKIGAIDFDYAKDLYTGAR